VEYATEAIVIVGATIELLADFEHILKGKEKELLRKRVEKHAAIALIVGLSLGFGALVRTNELFTEEIVAADSRAADALRKAKESDDKANAASNKATLADDRSERLGALLKTEQETTARFQRQASDSEARLAKATADLADEQRRLDLEARKRSPCATLIHNAYISDDLGSGHLEGRRSSL
jgi:hypothetical protein